MQRQENVPDQDATGLALTLIRTFGAGALPMVEEQAAVCLDNPELHRRWSEIRDALATLTGANAHMEAALDLLDKVGERSIPATLMQAIALLGFGESGNEPINEAMTVRTCGSGYFAERAQHHLEVAQRSTDDGIKAKHLDAASRYATMREQIDRSTPSPPS